ncbi:MAG: DUF4942 domain-containing protein [Chloroflexi bacterium]|nr:MAG: DUF4942 domain-containing protein [Chloroflexota bacterium]
MSDLLQFYPTPEALARKAWSLFESKDYRRILEPSAGRGDLLAPLRERLRWHGRVPVDVVELNIQHHPVLRDLGYDVVDTDFLRFRSPVIYSHIIMNPPFAQGVDHVLHAWDLLRDGELVAILNAETIDNPCTAKREQLRRLIAEHGRVEYVESAFQDPDTLRKTDVRVALVHLDRHEKISISFDAFCLKQENSCKVIDEQARRPNPLALPEGAIANIVRAFNAAVEAMQRSVRAEAEAHYYRKLIEFRVSGNGNNDAPKTGSGSAGISFATLADTLNERYEELKKHAWLRVFSTADFTSRFSRNVRAELESQLDMLTKMEFSEENIHAVLEGLLQSKTELDFRMLEEVFDEITRYHSDNRWYYRGWKSNDRHRLGWRIRTTRFILPRMKNWSGTGLDWEAEQKVFDIDRAFALLDGRTEPELGMLDAIKAHSEEFVSGQRISSDYFDVRFFKGIGTMHFFPRRKDLVERLNRIVGKRRQWLPDHPDDADKAFWMQYEKADRVTREMERRLAALPVWQRDYDHVMEQTHRESCEEIGIHLDALDQESVLPVSLSRPSLRSAETRSG